RAIVHLADILRTNVSNEDIVARFAAEEFGVLLKDVSSQKAVEIFERIRQNVQTSKTKGNNNEEINYTISIGLVTTNDENLDSSVNEADMLLYNAKQNGRNQIVVN
ncbi:MAG TPA: GGDEF domain-containing protein, partial [Sulfurimonas sp.]